MSYQQEKFKEIADAIREKTGTEEKILPTDFASMQQEVFDAGKKAEYDAFWDVFQQNGNLSNYNHAFYRWFDECYKPKYPIKTTLFTNGFAYSKIEDTLVDIEISENYQGNLLNKLFDQATKLKTIRKLVLPSKITTYTNCFANCTALENLTVEGEICGSFDLHWSPLSKESVESVVSALSDTVTGQTVTFNKAKTESIFDSADWEELKNLKPNWNFELA